jgi:ubiquinone/menaquinone biosynthesis C-methylase UbiE
MLFGFFSELRSFFDERAAPFLRKPEISLRDLCYVSGRDYRIWTDSVYDDLIQSIVSMLDLRPEVTLIEVGCAAGFLAKGLSPWVSEYYGVDVSTTSLKLAKRLGVPNAKFKRGNGTTLPFSDSFFDRAICYFVVTNISNLNILKRIISEMARVTRPGGRFLIGCVFDAHTQSDYQRRVDEVKKSLPPLVEDADIASRRWMPLGYKLLAMLSKKIGQKSPQVRNHYHEREFFLGVGEELKLEVEILPIHSLDPFRDYRYNVLYRKLE